MGLLKTAFICSMWHIAARASILGTLCIQFYSFKMNAFTYKQLNLFIIVLLPDHNSYSYMWIPLPGLSVHFWQDAAFMRTRPCKGKIAILCLTVIAFIDASKNGKVNFQVCVMEWDKAQVLLTAEATCQLLFLFCPLRCQLLLPSLSNVIAQQSPPFHIFSSSLSLFQQRQVEETKMDTTYQSVAWGNLFSCSHHRSPQKGKRFSCRFSYRRFSSINYLIKTEFTVKCFSPAVSLKCKPIYCFIQKCPLHIACFL